MNIRYTSSLFFVIGSFAGILFFTPIVHAQTPPQNHSLRFSCLEATRCTEDGDCTKKNVHRARLTPSSTAKAMPNDINTYLTECLDIDSDNNGVPETVCTTGDATLDKELFCGNSSSTDPQCNHFQMLKDRVGYSFDRTSEYGIFFIQNGQAIKQSRPSKIASDGLGNIIPPVIEWQSYTPDRTTRRYMIWNRVELQPNDPAGHGGQQQDDLEFPYQSSSCSGVSWDPYGRVFDTKSLEPIPDARVTLQQLDPTTNTMSETYANRQNPNIVNPFSTAKDGVFSFIVVDGSYALVPTHSNYTHSNAQSATLEQSNPNISRMYSEYYITSSPPIVQQGRIQHRDIPMEPNNGSGYTYPLVIVTHLEELLNSGSIRYSGVVSHPFANLQVMICDFSTGQEVCEPGTTYTSINGGPDRDGKFGIELDQKRLKPGQYYKKLFTPVDLKTPLTRSGAILNAFKKTADVLMGLLVSDASAQDNDRSLSTITNPIPSYIEGYAYDGQGNLLANAPVGVYVSFSDRPVYTTMTSARGYYKITSEFLPKTTYMIRYTSPNPPYIQTLLTTSQFMIQNKAFIESEKINVFLVTTAQTDPRRTITPSYIPTQKTSPLPNVTQIAAKPTESPAAQISTTPVPTPTKHMNSLILGIILLVMSAIGAGVLYFIIKRKK